MSELGLQANATALLYNRHPELTTRSSKQLRSWEGVKNWVCGEAMVWMVVGNEDAL
jgi:hypothetical protein